MYKDLAPWSCVPVFLPGETVQHRYVCRCKPISLILHAGIGSFWHRLASVLHQQHCAPSMPCTRVPTTSAWLQHKCCCPFTCPRVLMVISHSELWNITAFDRDCQAKTLNWIVEIQREQMLMMILMMIRKLRRMGMRWSWWWWLWKPPELLRFTQEQRIFPRAGEAHRNCDGELYQPW